MLPPTTSDIGLAEIPTLDPEKEVIVWVLLAVLAVLPVAVQCLHLILTMEASAQVR